MSDRAPLDDSRAADGATPDQTDAIRVLLHRALWHAIESAPRVVPGTGSVAPPIRGARGADDGAIEGAARECIRAACAAARERAVPVERLLVQLKEAWARVPDAERVARREGDAILARVITLCIVEFYATDRSRRPENGSDA